MCHSLFPTRNIYIRANADNEFVLASAAELGTLRLLKIVEMGILTLCKCIQKMKRGKAKDRSKGILLSSALKYS